MEHTEQELLQEIQKLFKRKHLTKLMKEEILELIEFKIVLDSVGIKAKDVKDLMLLMAKSYDKGQQDYKKLVDTTLDKILQDYQNNNHDQEQEEKGD